jgi:hypothetical protein
VEKLLIKIDFKYEQTGLMSNNITNNNSFGAGPPGQPFEVQNSTDGESTTNRVAKQKLEEIQKTNTDLAQQNPEGKHRKIKFRTPSEIFPHELWIYIFSFLDFKDLPPLRLASKELRDLAHETLKCGLEIMTYKVLFYIGVASKSWNLTIQLEPFNLNPIHTKSYKVGNGPDFKKFPRHPWVNDWVEERGLHCNFLKRAHSLTALDLSGLLDQETDKEDVESNNDDFREIMEDVSSSLEHLDLSRNYFEIPAVLATLKTHGCALKTLFLNNTLLQNKKSPTENKELPTVDLNDLPRTLQSLNLSSLKKLNEMPSFQLTGDFPTSLIKLNLADNILPENSLPSLPSSLTYLDCSFMRTKTINNKQTFFFKESALSIIKELPFGSLVTLNLSNNWLTDKFLQVIMQNPNSPLEKIDLSGNYITFTKINGAFPPRLKYLNLDSNKISHLDRLYVLLLNHQVTAKTPISLKEISIKGNPLKNDFLEDFEELKILTQFKELFKL